MTQGLYLPDGTFLDFADSGREGMLVEIATRAAAGVDLSGFLNWLPDPDPVLAKRGDSAVVLKELLADDQVCACVQIRKLKTLNKQDYGFSPSAPEGQKPTPEAKRICDDLRKDMERWDFFNLRSEILDTPYFGYTVVELLWKAQGGRLRLANAVVKPRDWFAFDTKNELVFRPSGTVEGKPLPFGKFLLARHFPTFENPYGLRLLSRCLWPVAFKKGGLRFWMSFAEKFGMPWIVGHAPQNAVEADMRAMASKLAAMVADAVAVVSSGSQVDVHESSGKPGDVHKVLVEHNNASISKVLMGQTLTAEVGDKGSYAASQTHLSVLAAFADADELLTVSAMNDLAWIYTQLNAAAGTLAPVFSFVKPEDRQAKADLDGKLNKVGVRFLKVHFERGYGLPADEFEVADPRAAGRNDPTETALSLADGSGAFAPDQQAIEDLVAQVLPEAVAANAALAGQIASAVAKAESFEDLQILLAEILGNEADQFELEDLLSRVMANAALFGQAAVAKEDGHAG